MEDFSGYRGRSLEFLKKSDVQIGDVVEVTTDWGTVTGTLVPRYQYDDESHLVLKLRSGYNVGVSLERMRSLKRKSKGEKPSFKPPPPPKASRTLPEVSILGTGGTIASRVDYRTGAVRAAITSEELYALIPELSEIARIDPQILFSLYSENIEPENWSTIARTVADRVNNGAQGVVITHGTDTLGYTAAALSFALQGVPAPIVLVAAQRSSDRPSSDAVLNLVAGVSVAARADFAGVYLAMHANDSDGRVAIHAGTRARKDHTSARDAFESIGVPLAAVWTSEGLQKTRDDLPKRGAGGKFAPRTKFEPRVALLKYYPSLPTSIIESIVQSGTKAIVLEGTGLGHINSKNISPVGDFIRGGGLAFMTSQCIRGRVDMNVYETGRDLLAAGVIPLDDMLSETALVKAMWVLGNTRSVEEAKSWMTKNLAGEINERTLRWRG
jgi:glutamyl-tRNA(Gln) amidotransferase subunit D